MNIPKYESFTLEEIGKFYVIDNASLLVNKITSYLNPKMYDYYLDLLTLDYGGILLVIEFGSKVLYLRTPNLNNNKFTYEQLDKGDMVSNGNFEVEELEVLIKWLIKQ